MKPEEVQAIENAFVAVIEVAFSGMSPGNPKPSPDMIKKVRQVARAELSKMPPQPGEPEGPRVAKNRSDRGW